MNNTIYNKIYTLYLKYTKSKPVGVSELEKVKKEIGNEVLNTKLKDEEPEDLDISIYFNRKD